MLGDILKFSYKQRYPLANTPFYDSVNYNPAKCNHPLAELLFLFTSSSLFYTENTNMLIDF